MEGPDVIAQADLDPAFRTARTLAPGIRDLLGQIGWKPADVALVAVVIGPGSFTGLRLGVMTAKAFAYGIGAAIMGIDTLAVIASQTPADAERVAVAVDAQRGDVYCAEFTRATPGGVLQRVAPIEIAAANDWLAKLPAGTMLTGPALAKLPIAEAANYSLAARDVWLPRAVTVGQLAAARWTAGERDDLWSLAPLYLRRSAAEEKRDAAK